MKQAENNEMDLLLRSLGRHEGARSGDAEDHAAGHLDVDELNSYAEQALPAAARARYTAHLADCASCRKSVSELASASGARVSELAVPQKTTTGLREKLSALFSFNVLRYAVPALALFTFVAIGLVALRQQREADYVAQNQSTASPNSTLQDSPTAPANAAGSAYDSSSQIKEPSSEARTNARKADDFSQAKPGAVTETGTATDATTVNAERDEAPAKSAGAVAQPSYAPEPAAAPPPAKPQPTQVESRTEVAAREKEAADKKNEPAREQESTRARPDDNQTTTVTGRTTSLDGLREERLSKLEAKRRPSPGAKAKDDDADTRTVSGRRFRRQGGVWIDTAYKSPSATTSLARGSEQFRALVADEPGIRAIAEQLAGEVVVVWKGRAYRIR